MCIRDRYGIVPDVSHLSDEGVAEVFECYDGPVVATHSNVRRVTGHHRNLTEKVTVRSSVGRYLEHERVRCV